MRNRVPDDQRSWVETDRPGERVAITAPLPGTRVMSVVASDRLWSELHEVHTVCLVHPGQRGVGAWWRCGRTDGLETGSGEMMVMSLGDYHRTMRVTGKADFSVVQIDPSIVDGMAEELEFKRSPRVRPLSANSAELRRSVLRFVQGSALRTDALDLECSLRDLVRDLWGACGDLRIKFDPVVHRGIRRARDAIREMFLAPDSETPSPRLAYLADVSGLSAARFSHAFKHWVGMSPHAYLNLCRLSAGRRMLEGGLSATEAASALGFADLPHFSRHFRRQFGLPPRLWTRARVNTTS